MENDKLHYQPILIVEDNKANMELLLQQLEVLGYTVETATNGEEAFAKMATQTFRFILTDINMPIMDGYQLAKKIRESERQSGQRNIIIAITAKALIGEKEKCLELGMDGYLAKPVDIFALKAMLEQWEQ